MDPAVEAAVRGTIDAINDRTLRARAEEFLDPSIMPHDLVPLLPDTKEATGGSYLVGMILAAMPNFRLTIADIFGAGDRAVVRPQDDWDSSEQPLLGRPATHKKLSANAVFIYRVEQGRIAEAWQMIDGLAFFRLAGFLADPSE